MGGGVSGQGRRKGFSRRSLTLARKAFGAGEGNCVCAGLRVWSAHGVRNKPGTVSMFKNGTFMSLFEHGARDRCRDCP
jgi:hypothetical protein